MKKPDTRTSRTRNVRDRTAEFFATVALKRKRPRRQRPDTHRRKDPPRPTRRASRPRPDDGKSVILTAAAAISKGLQRATTRLGHLAQLTKKSSLFDNQQEKIQHVSSEIEDDIEKLKDHLSTLERLQAAHRGGTSDEKQHVQSIVRKLKQQCLGVTQEFQQVLKTSMDNMSRQQARRNQYVSKRAPRMRNRGVQRRRRLKGALSNQYDPSSETKESEMAPLTAASHMSQEQAMEGNTYLQERSNAVLNIEQRMTGLAELYQRLSCLVAEQDDYFVRIESNVDDTQQNLTMGMDELNKYYSSISTNRWLIIKVFAILIIFAIFFTLFVA